MRSKGEREAHSEVRREGVAMPWTEAQVAAYEETVAEAVAARIAHGGQPDWWKGSRHASA